MGTCINCKNKNIRIFTCDACKETYCKDCADLSATEVAALDLKNRKMRFFCKKCDDSMSLLPKLTEMIKNMQMQIDQLINANVRETNHTNVDVDIISNEVQDRIARSKNVILYNVPEPVSHDTNTRIQQDRDTISTILNDDLKVNVEFSRAIRLGRRGDGLRPRPLKIICNEAYAAVEILKKRSLCKNGVKINNDLTPLQRENMRKIRDELNERKTKGETDITIKYVRGVPQIVALNNKSKN